MRVTSGVNSMGVNCPHKGPLLRVRNWPVAYLSIDSGLETMIGLCVNSARHYSVFCVLCVSFLDSGVKQEKGFN